MGKKVIKRDGRIELFDLGKVVKALESAFRSQGYELPEAVKQSTLNTLKARFKAEGDLHVEDIQDTVERCLMECREYDVAKAYILYRDKHKDLRLIQERVDYMDNYINSSANAATSSEEDANANVGIKNVANLDGEVHKNTNRKIQRYRMVKKLKEMYPEVADRYEEDIEHRIIYPHDEASVPTVKNYCEAVTIYPMIQDGTRSMDGLGTTPPHYLSSFCGQLVNTTFLLAAQCKGAVAFGEFFNFLDYFCAKDFGEDYHLQTQELSSIRPKRTIENAIHQAYQQIVYGWNQPAGNRSYQSPFTNISYYDKNYWTALFKDFCFPDGTKPVWERVDFLQKDFMQWFNKERTRTMLTFPVETMALLSDGKGDILDKDYKDFTAEMYSKGHSFFTYISDNPDSLSSCCRLRNKLDANTFSFTNGLTGVQTGSCNVITLNLNRIIQDYFDEIGFSREEAIKAWKNLETETQEDFKGYLIDILERVYKYHKAYKSLLYEVEEKGMLNASTAGYIRMDKLYSTIGLNGINEMAEFLGIKCNDTEEYRNLCRLVTGTISEQDTLHKESKFMFNCEFVPAESLGSKNYKWDKEDGYWVPEDRNLYNSYFFIQSDETKSVLDKMRMHGRDYTELLDGGVGCHINLEDHLSKKQYEMLLEYAVKVGCTYFTFNIPNSECEDCYYIEKRPLEVCPKCGGTHIAKYSRVIGYLRKITNFDKDRQVEAATRYYAPKSKVNTYL